MSRDVQSPYGLTRCHASGGLRVVGTVVNTGFHSAPEPDQSEGPESGRDKSRTTVITPDCSQVNIVDVPWPRVSVVIPAMNEARNLPHVFALIPRTVHEVILVDGHSVDDTVAVARELWPDVRVVAQNRIGKGNALACGFAAAAGDIIAMIDADGSADPGEIPAFVKALLDGADFAKGTRSGSRAEAVRTSPGCGVRVTECSAHCSTHATRRAIQISATATTCSGGGTCRYSAWTAPHPCRTTGTEGCGATGSRSRR